MGIEPAPMSHITQPRFDSTVDALKITASNGKELSDEDGCIKKFSRYCQSFYNSSLVLTSSSTSLDKNMGHAMSNNEQMVSQGKIVMEALDRIGAMRVATANLSSPHPLQIQRSARKSLIKLREEHEMAAESYRDLLDECGLLDVDRFINQVTNPTETRNSASYEQYIHTRDAIRRRSHKLAMVQRQSSLYQLLLQNEQVSSLCETTNKHDSSTHMTQMKHVKHAILTIEQFVRKYKQNIGSHSFLAGLYCLIHNQLHIKSKNEVVQWSFMGSVLTEACHMNDAGDTEAYARDSTHVLFSFLTWIKSKDVEGGKSPNNIGENSYNLTQMSQALDEDEPLLHFQVNRYISNSNLRRIMSALPCPNDLDARATGTTEVLDAEDGNGEVQVRMNIDGHLDEKWPWWQNFCHLL